MKKCNLILSEEKRIAVTDEFIKKNKLHIARTQEAIVHKIGSSTDMLGFKLGVLIDYIDFEHAKPFLKPEYVEKCEKGKEKWKHITDIKEAVQDFLDYMAFAWRKAIDQRGISAGRSIEKLSTYMWLLGREDLLEILVDDNKYNPYGSPALIECCGKLGIDVPEELMEFSKVRC